MDNCANDAEIIVPAFVIALLIVIGVWGHDRDSPGGGMRGMHDSGSPAHFETEMTTQQFYANPLHTNSAHKLWTVDDFRSWAAKPPVLPDALDPVRCKLAVSALTTGTGDHCIDAATAVDAGFDSFVNSSISGTFSIGQFVLLNRSHRCCSKVGKLILLWSVALLQSTLWVFLWSAALLVIFCGLSLLAAMFIRVDNDNYDQALLGFSILGWLCFVGAPSFLVFPLYSEFVSFYISLVGIILHSVDNQVVDLGVVRTITTRNQHPLRFLGFKQMSYFYDVEIAGTSGASFPARGTPGSHLTEAADRSFDKAKKTHQAEYYESLEERVGSDLGGTAWMDEVGRVSEKEISMRGVIAKLQALKESIKGCRGCKLQLSKKVSFKGFCDDFAKEIEHESEEIKRELCGQIVLTIDGNQVLCKLSRFSSHGNSSDFTCSSKPVMVLPKCGESDIQNTPGIEGNVAVMQRTQFEHRRCNLVDQFDSIVAAGAIAIIVINGAANANNQDFFATKCSGDFKIPVLVVRHATGQLLAKAGSVKISHAHSRRRCFRDEAIVAVVFKVYGHVISDAMCKAQRDFSGLSHRHSRLLSMLAGPTHQFSAPDCFQCCKLLKKGPGFGWEALVDGAIAEARKRASEHNAREVTLSSTHCLTAYGETLLILPEPQNFAPGGYRHKGELQKSTVIRFVSNDTDLTGRHSAVRTGVDTYAFPPMTLFRAESVQLDLFEYDGTQDLLEQCRGLFGGKAPEPTVEASSGRFHVTRTQLIDWLAENSPPNSIYKQLHEEQADVLSGSRQVYWKAVGIIRNLVVSMYLRLGVCCGGIILFIFYPMVFALRPMEQQSSEYFPNRRLFGALQDPEGMSGTGSDTPIDRGGLTRMWLFGAVVSVSYCAISAMFRNGCSEEYLEARCERAMDMFHRAWLPPGVKSTIYMVHQTRVTVRATYFFPTVRDHHAHQAVSGGGRKMSCKLVSDSSELKYGDRMAFVRGVTEILLLRPLTMAEEWARNLKWKDWNGASFRGKEEWDYVWSKPAEEGRGGVVLFDKGHDGMFLADFRQLFIDRVIKAVGGSDEQILAFVPTLEEVAAARLYTGPAYVKLNGFMRLVGEVPERHWRARFSQLRSFTYSSTVFHLINAIRKITQIDALERQGQVMLYRGVRGKMPAEFYKKDEQGLMSAVDYGFASTSTDPTVPISFMDPDQQNILWVMHGSHTADSSTGMLHNGAVLQPLSQFPAEAEALLPPLCMLQVLREGEEAGMAGAFRIADRVGTNNAGDTVKYQEIHVLPCFTQA
jgi:hypothetical protein